MRGASSSVILPRTDAWRTVYRIRGLWGGCAARDAPYTSTHDQRDARHRARRERDRALLHPRLRARAARTSTRSRPRCSCASTCCARLRCRPAVRERLRVLAGKRVSRDGVLIITAHRFRSQEQNRRDAIERLVALIREAAVPPQDAPGRRAPPAHRASAGSKQAPARRDQARPQQPARFHMTESGKPLCLRGPNHAFSWIGNKVNAFPVYTATVTSTPRFQARFFHLHHGDS